MSDTSTPTKLSRGAKHLEHAVNRLNKVLASKTAKQEHVSQAHWRLDEVWRKIEAGEYLEKEEPSTGE